ncbi:MAG: radical SAM protein [Candidatus Aminicenantes bacterium]|jgi:radical SAM protein with 4Fe4S-binding SPASM domain
MKNLKVSKYLHFQPVDHDIYVGWNRFFPSIFIFNRPALELLHRIRDDKPLQTNEEIKYYLKEFKKYKFIYEGECDPSQKDFLNMVQQHLDELNQRAADFYRLKEDYSALSIVNDVCNLDCPYCINRYQQSPKKGTGLKNNSRYKRRIIYDCVDQFFARKIKKGIGEVSIAFNGGEILLDWKIIKDMVQRISQKYPGIKVNYQMNTNLTLLTEAMARFFDRYHFKVNVSIDGYKEAHDKTRKYHNGRGSFDDIIKKIELYRKTNNTDSIKAFQGTIENIDDFQPEAVYKMKKYGFVTARLAPNLLNCSEGDGKKKAKLMGRFLALNSQHQFQVTELLFTKVKQGINQKEYQFSLNCPGLSGPPKKGIEINITTLSVSHLCGFIPHLAIPIKTLSYDIYHPQLWQVSYEFINQRKESMLKNCIECPLLALCRGGCILSGLDTQNRVNKAACAYQREIWKIYLKKAYQDRKG